MKGLKLESNCVRLFCTYASSLAILVLQCNRYQRVKWIRSGVLDGIDPSVVNLPKVNALMEKINQHPKVKEFLKVHHWFHVVVHLLFLFVYVQNLITSSCSIYDFSPSIERSC